MVQDKILPCVLKIKIFSLRQCLAHQCRG